MEVSEHKYSEKDSVTFVKIKLCLVVKTSDGPLVDAVFIDKLKTGYLFEGFEVRKDSAKFEPVGRCQHLFSYLISQLINHDQSINQATNQPLKGAISTPFFYMGREYPLPLRIIL